MQDKAPTAARAVARARAATPYCAVLAGKIWHFLLDISIKVLTENRGKFVSGKAEVAGHTLCISRFFGKIRRKSRRQDVCGDLLSVSLDFSISDDMIGGPSVAIGEPLDRVPQTPPDLLNDRGMSRLARRDQRALPSGHPRPLKRPAKLLMGCDVSAHKTLRVQ